MKYKESERLRKSQQIANTFGEVCKNIELKLVLFTEIFSSESYEFSLPSKY